MTHERFEALLEELDGESVQTLVTKNARYSSSDDALHNFTAGGEVFGGTAAQACWGYLTKHLVALRDMVQRNDFHNRADLLEKCQDSINYIRFLWCIANEEMKKYTCDDATCCAEQKVIGYRCKICGCTFAGAYDPLKLIEHLTNEHGNQTSIPDAGLVSHVVDKYFEKEIK